MIIKIISSCMVVLLVPALLGILLKFSKTKCLENEIRWSKAIFVIGMFGLTFFWTFIPIMCILELDPSMNWWESLLFSLPFLLIISALGLYLTLLPINWRVVVYDDHVEYYNIFKKKKIYNFSEYEVKQYSATVRVVKPYINKKGKKKYKLKVNISYYCINYEVIIEKYRQFKKAEKIRKREEREAQKAIQNHQ